MRTRARARDVVTSGHKSGRKVAVVLQRKERGDVAPTVVVVRQSGRREMGAGRKAVGSTT
jgi:hypothetical protein